MSPRVKVVYSPGRIAGRVASLGKRISRDYAGRTVDVVVILENGFIFAADLVRHIEQPVVCSFVRTEVRDVKMGRHLRREVFFSRPPDLRGRDVLVVSAVLASGVTQEFLLRRLQESRPRTLRMAVLVDKPQDRKLDLRPDYIGFAVASNHYVGYGLPGTQRMYGNLPGVGLLAGTHRRGARRGRRARKAR